MQSLKILALSSSKVGNSGYLQNAAPLIKNFLGDNSLQIAFVPFASVDRHDEYLYKVKEGLKQLPYIITLVEPENGEKVIEESDVIMIGGGNTFKLLHDLYAHNLMEFIRSKVHTGTPYIGWSAGANIAGKSISTTNDMPIIEPESFKALNFLPFQINPHYLNLITDDHNGETRDQRIEEFIKMNPLIPVIGMPEGSALLLDENKLTYTGNSKGVLFTSVEDKSIVNKKEIEVGENLTELLHPSRLYNKNIISPNAK